MIKLDVLVVYSAGIATSASVADENSLHPFLLKSPRANYNLSYAHFLRACAKLGLSAGFTTSGDIIAPGKCSNYWSLENGTWKKNHQPAFSQHIFDKISPVSAKRRQERTLLLSDPSIRPFNNRELFHLFFDKLATYKQLPKYSIPSVGINSSESAEIEKSLSELNHLMDTHPFPNDFKDKFVLKDRFGAGGNNVYEIKDSFSTRIQKIMAKKPSVRFILQPFLAFDKGFKYNNQASATDIRLIFYRSQLLQCYIRIAASDDFRCNEHQGGELVYIDQQAVPKRVLKIAGRMADKINKPNSLYALDFAVSNNGNVYCVEGNNGPGIDWDTDKKINEQKSKQLINKIVGEFAYRLSRPKAEKPAGELNYPLIGELYQPSQAI